MENSENKMEGLPKEPQVSQPTPDQNLIDEVVPAEVLVDEPKAQPDTPESPAEEKEREIQPQEPQVSIPKDLVVDKPDKVEPNEAPAYERSHQKPDNPSDIFRRDLKRIKSSVDDSFSRLGKKLNDLLNLDGKDQNK